MRFFSLENFNHYQNIELRRTLSLEQVNHRREIKYIYEINQNQFKKPIQETKM